MSSNEALTHNPYPEKDQEEAELRAERDRLLAVLDACGGRNIEVAEEIDEITRLLGESEEDEFKCPDPNGLDCHGDPECFGH